MKVLRLSAVIASLMVGSLSAYEEQINPYLVYEIGGKAKIKKRKNRTVPVGAGVRWKMPQCGNFDMSLSVTNIMSGVSGELESLGEDIVNSMTGVVSNWLWMEIARADPQLYEMLQQGKLEASELFGASVASCEEMTDKIISNGYGSADSVGDWVSVSGFEQWSDNTQDGVIDNQDVVQVEDSIDEDSGDAGVEWVDGDKAGGENQPPIRVVEDVAKAGVNILSNRNPKSNSSLPTGNDAPYYSKYWDTPEAVANWIIDVVGETIIRTCVDCNRLETTPGRGVYAKIEEEQKRIDLRLNELLDDTLKITYEADELEEISAPGYYISQQVMEALKTESGVYRGTLIDRLTEEVAISLTVERLIAARRILLSGKREAYIAKKTDALMIADSRIAELTEEMELLKSDAELRNMTRNSVASYLINRKQSRQISTKPITAKSTSKAIRNITGRNQ